MAPLARSLQHRRRDAAFERRLANAGKRHTDVAGEVVELAAVLAPVEIHVGAAEQRDFATVVAPLHRRPFRGRWRASMAQ